MVSELDLRKRKREMKTFVIERQDQGMNIHMDLFTTSERPPRITIGIGLERSIAEVFRK